MGQIITIEEIDENPVKNYQHKDLQELRQAARERIDVVFFVKLELGEIKRLRVVLVLGAQRLQFTIDGAHFGERFERFPGASQQ